MTSVVSRDDDDDDDADDDASSLSFRTTAVAFARASAITSSPGSSTRMAFSSMRAGTVRCGIPISFKMARRLQLSEPRTTSADASASALARSRSACDGDAEDAIAAGRERRREEEEEEEEDAPAARRVEGATRAATNAARMPSAEDRPEPGAQHER